MKEGIGFKLFSPIYWGVLLGNPFSALLSAGLSVLVLVHYYSKKEFTPMEWGIIALCLSITSFGASIVSFFVLYYVHNKEQQKSQS